MNKLLTVEQINKHIDKFTQIYDENGDIKNPIPEDKKVTVWCDTGGWDYSGFACNIMASELGITILIATSWIYEDELRTLCK